MLPLFRSLEANGIQEAGTHPTGVPVYTWYLGSILVHCTTASCLFYIGQH